MRQELVWQSQLEQSDVVDLTTEELEHLCNCLDEAVMLVCSDFGLFQ